MMHKIRKKLYIIEKKGKQIERKIIKNFMLLCNKKIIKINYKLTEGKQTKNIEILINRFFFMKHLNEKISFKHFN